MVRRDGYKEFVVFEYRVRKYFKKEEVVNLLEVDNRWSMMRIGYLVIDSYC